MGARTAHTWQVLMITLPTLVCKSVCASTLITCANVTSLCYYATNTVKVTGSLQAQLALSFVLLIDGENAVGIDDTSVLGSC